ncbi:MAG: lipoprotein LpqH [Mycobacteriaceae bacterium]|nr:lipoprotein LpqH [Mycobacteriaceae bacterium]
MGCSSSSGSTAQVSAGSGTEVQVDGKPLQGLDTNTVTCVRQAGQIKIASGAVSGQQGLAVVMSDANPPQVQSLAMLVDGNMLGVSNTGGPSAGSADVKVNGDTYTITGQAAGADIKNPMAGIVSKPFSIKVNCH